MLWSEIQEEVRKSGGVIQPSPGDVHVNRPLTNISIAYMQMDGAFVADRVFPNIPVMKQSDAFWEYDREAWLRSQMAERAPGTEAAVATYMVSTGSYHARVYALKDFVDDQTRANSDTPLGPDADATNFLTAQAMLQREKAFADAYLKAGVWNLSADGAAARSASLNLADTNNNNLVHWSAAMSTPIADVKAMKRAVQMRTGFRPNGMVIGREVYDVLTEHDDIIERMDRGQTPGSPARANLQDLMMLFELDDLMVMDAIEATNALGASAAYSFINGKSGLLYYRPASPGLRVPSAGYTFSWNGYVGAGGMGNRIKRYRVESRSSDCIEIESAYDFKRVSADLAVWLNGIVA